MINNLAESLGISTTIIYIVIGLIALSIVVTLVKKILGFAVLAVAILIIIYIVFGITPSQSIDKVGSVTSQFSEKVEIEKLVSSLDKLAVKVDEQGREVLENEDFKIAYNEAGEKIVEFIDTQEIIKLDELKEKMNPEELKKLEKFLEQ